MVACGRSGDVRFRRPNSLFVDKQLVEYCLQRRRIMRFALAVGAVSIWRRLVDGHPRRSDAAAPEFDKAKSAHAIAREGPLLVELEHCNPALDVVEVELLSLNLNDSRGIVDLSFGFAELCPPQLCDEYVLRAGRVEADARDLDDRPARKSGVSCVILLAVVGRPER